MTTPGAVVADQPTAASKANVGRARETGAKGEPPAGEGEQGFGEILSELKGQDGHSSGNVAVPDASAGTGERTNVRRREIEAQLAAVDEADHPSRGPSADWLSGDLAQVGDALEDNTAPDAAPTVAPQPVTAVVTAIAAMAAPTTIEHSAGREPDPSKATPTPAAVAAATRAIPDGQSAPTDVRPPPAVEGMAKDQLEQSDAGLRLAGAIDPVLARFSPRGTSAGKATSEAADSNLKLAAAIEPAPGDTADVAAAMQRHAPPTVKDPPKASVLRQETHFAPVSSTAPRAGASLEDSAAMPGTGPEARSTEAPVAARSLEATLLPPDESASLTAPPAQQIADRIVDEAGPAAPLADRAGVIPEQSAPPKPVLRIVQVQLQPADLGTVTVRMELKDAELTLQVESDRTETVELIRSDQDTLARLLRAAGYSVDTSSIRIVEGDRAAASQQVGQHGGQTNLQSSPQSQSGAWERQEHAQREGTSGGDARPQTSRNEIHETTTNRAGLGLYI
jgi:chemotaxis protein MotD